MRLEGRRLGMFGLAALVAALAVGCGGGGETSAPSVAAFTEQANAICKQGIAQRNAAVRGLMKRDPEAFTHPNALLAAALTPLHEVVRQIGALQVPPGMEGEIQRIVSSFEGGFQRAEADPAAVASGATDPLANARALMAKSNLEACKSL